MGVTLKRSMVGIDDIKRGITENMGTIAIGAGVITAGAVLGAVALSRKKSKKRVKRTSKSRGRSRDRKFISKQKWERRYKRKTRGKRYKTKHSKRSRKGLHYTKNGQPYKILANGRARFVSKSNRRKK